MRRIEKAKNIALILDSLFPNPDVPLNHRDPFTLLIAVLLSAQCTDERVNKVTPELFKMADNAEKMAACTIDEIQKIIKPCGLSARKASAISSLSKILLKTYHGIVPRSIEQLETLPGVGHKTASVVVSQAFGIPAFPVDTHIHRLAYRWGLSNGKNVEKTEADLKKLFPEEIWNKIHLQIIYYGRAYCPARGHDVERCSICKNYGRKNAFKKDSPKPSVK